ncbi:MAG: cation transporter [Clostridia bacterium]|nr:cation transporter [Clostridia bacterium]
MNLLLAVAKLIVGFMIHSRAILLDAVNGLTDMVTALLSMISTLFANRRRDRKHPFGYGRLEYVTSMFSAVFIIIMAVHSIIGAVGDLMNGGGNVPKYNSAVVVLMVISLLAKVIYGLATRNLGKRIDAIALILGGTESLGDALVSAAILGSIVLYRVAQINLEPLLSIVISIYLVKTGVELISETSNKLIGRKGDPELYLRIKKMIAEEEAVQNVFYLVLHNYGEEILMGSVDIEVDEGMSVAESTVLIRKIREMAMQQGVILSSVGVYGTCIRDPKNAEMWDSILTIIRKYPIILRAYAFSFNPDSRVASFHIVPDPSAEDGQKSVERIKKELAETFPEITFDISEILDI